MTSLPVLSLFADTLPPLRAGQLGATGFDVVPVLMLVGAGALYVWGVTRVNRLQPRHRWSGWRTAALFAALVVTAVAIFSFIGVYDSVLFWDHMIQHLLLIMVASAFFAMASPLDLAWRATTGRPHALVTQALRSPVARFFGHPGVAFVLYAVVIPVSHLTQFYNYTLQNEQVHDTEHLLFLVVGYLFWRQIFGADPNRYRMHPALQFAYLFLAIPVDTFTGLSLTGVGHEIFPAYTAMHRTWGPSLVTDLHIGGVIMWVGGDTLMLLPMIPIALRWMRMEERRAVRVDRELDAMLPLDRDVDPGPADPGRGPEGARA
jgi:cytochrome c oxidase assembly factor CtaG